MYGIGVIGYNAFSHKIPPVAGTLSFLAIVGLFIWFVTVINSKQYRWRTPSFGLVFWSTLGVLLVCAFAGIQPLAGYKDSLVNKTGNIINTVQDTAKDTSPSKTPTTSSNPISTINQQEQKSLLIGQQVVAIVNGIRAKRGSTELSWDDTLYKYSKEHSVAMAEQRRLFHTDMNMPYAENAWGGEGSKNWTAETMVNSWMDSPKHRTWLLCPNLKHVAVGVAYSQNGMYASWTFWRAETQESDWWYQYTPDNPPKWWY